ncbi:MAG: DNA polymerase III subunit beta [Deltaproteobacteria bacterium]|nr:DNA polymerase III subunit beta [Deltaproteobacteria bacterium]
MELRIDRDDLYKAVSRVQSIIEKRSNMPILSAVLLSAEGSGIVLSATDLEISFQQKLPAEVLDPGSLAISGRKLFEIVKESKGSTIYIKEKENHWAFISDDRAKFNMACLSPDEYPMFVEPEDVSFVDIDGSVLREMISKTIYAVTMEDAGFKLSGIYTEKVVQGGKSFLRLVATDGHRLSMIDKEVANIEDLTLDGGVMIPKKGMNEIAKLASDDEGVQIGFRQNNCVARKGDSLIVVRLLESKFPDYNAVIPKKAGHTIRIALDDLLDGMRKMTILSDESYRGVKIKLGEDTMELVSINPDIGDVQESLAVDYKGEKLEMGFNARYFIDILQAMESEEVTLGFMDGSSPCLVTGEGDVGFLGLIMPMRL